MICPSKPPSLGQALKLAVALLFVLITLASLCSCAPKRAVCERNYGPCGEPSVTRIIRKVDTTIVRPSAVVHDTVRLVQPGDTIVQVDSSGRAQLTYWRNRAGQLMARCEAKPDTVRVTQTVTKEVEVAADPVERPWWHLFKNLLWGLLVAGLVFFIVWRIIK